MPSERQHLAPNRTTWHITFGTYGSRLHGADDPTVDRTHHEVGTPFLEANPARRTAERDRMMR